MRMIEKRISCGCCLAVAVSLMASGHARGEEEDVLPGTVARSQLLGTVQAENFVMSQVLSDGHRPLVGREAGRCNRAIARIGPRHSLASILLEPENST